MEYVQSAEYPNWLRVNTRNADKRRMPGKKLHGNDWENPEESEIDENSTPVKTS